MASYFRRADNTLDISAYHSDISFGSAALRAKRTGVEANKLDASLIREGCELTVSLTVVSPNIAGTPYSSTSWVSSAKSAGRGFDFRCGGEDDTYDFEIIEHREVTEALMRGNEVSVIFRAPQRPVLAVQAMQLIELRIVRSRHSR